MSTALNNSTLKYCDPGNFSERLIFVLFVNFSEFMKITNLAKYFFQD